MPDQEVVMLFSVRVFISGFIQNTLL